MSITVTWATADKTAIYTHYQLSWTLADFVMSQAEQRRLMSSVTHRVHLIFDISAGVALPKNAISRFREEAKHVLPNQGVIIFIGANHFAKSIIRVLQTTVPSILKSDEIYFVATREEAHVLVSKMGETA